MPIWLISKVAAKWSLQQQLGASVVLVCGRRGARSAYVISGVLVKARQPIRGEPEVTAL